MSERETSHAAQSDEQIAANTDREIWRKGDGDGNGMSYYEPSMHVTQDGRIGINVGGTVFELPVEEWHSLAAEKHTAPPIAASIFYSFPEVARSALCPLLGGGLSDEGKEMWLRLRLQHDPPLTDEEIFAQAIREMGGMVAT